MLNASGLTPSALRDAGARDVVYSNLRGVPGSEPVFGIVLELTRRPLADGRNPPVFTAHADQGT